MPDLDQTATIYVTSRDGSLFINVSLPDSRAAIREVHDVGALTNTLESLLTLPPESTVKDVNQSPQQPSTDEPPAREGKLEARRQDQPKTSRLRRQRSGASVTRTVIQALPMGIEFGGTIHGTVDASPTYWGLGPQAFAVLRLRSWILGVSTSWGALQETPAARRGVETQTVSMSVDVGKRMPLGPASLDLAVGPWLVTVSQTAGDHEDEVGGAESDVRFGTLARLLLGKGHFRWVIQLDGSVSPWRLARSHRLDPSLPALPGWGLGLGVGAEWGSP